MMKISKPILMNDFMVSHVQFTSLNLVSFKNVKAVYNGNEKIQLEYEFPTKVEVSPRDWIGIFPRGWSNLQQYVTFEWISLSKATNTDNSDNGDVIRRTIAFCPKYHKNCVNQSALYQFVYVGKQIEILGVSSYFRFDLSCINEPNLEIECLVPVTGRVRSTSLSDFGTISMTTEQSSTSIESRKLMQTSSIHRLQNLDIEEKVTWSRMNFTDDKKNMCLMKKTGTAAGHMLNPYSSYSEPGFPMSFSEMQCKKCYHFKKGGDILRLQQVLQSKVGPCSEEALGSICHRRILGNPNFLQYKLKIVMERNKILEERAQDTKKELDKLQGELKRLKMTFYNVNKEKVAYEKFVKDFIKSLEKDSIVRVMYGNTEILVKKVNYVGMEEHPRDKKTSKRERELKAVIGLQEITIRNLINSLQEKAKSVEELNQTVKLAQMFATARTDGGDLEIGAEDTGDELSNSDLAGEYEYSLAKPLPPEEVSGDADDVLSSIRRTSEMELKNIGITRSLVNRSESDLDVTNLSIMPYDSESAVPKKPRMVDGIEDCWPFPRNHSITLRQKLSEDSINVKEGEIHTGMTNEREGDDFKSERGTVEQEVNSDVDASTFEDYYDAYDAFSVRSVSPESDNLEEDIHNDKEENEKDDKMKEAVVPREIRNIEEAKDREESDNKISSDKFSKFTYEVSIDFVQRRCQPSQMSDKMMVGQEEIKSQQNAVALCDQTKGSQMCSLDRERSLITFQKSTKGLEIKIRKVDQKENPARGFHQKMVVEYSGMNINEEQSSAPVQIFGDNQQICMGSISNERREIIMDGREFMKSRKCLTSASEPKEGKEETHKTTEKDNEINEFSPKSISKDTNEDLQKENRAECEEEFLEHLNTVEEMDRINNEDEKMENTPEEWQNESNNQSLIEDKSKNMNLHQDSLRYEKNLLFLNSKFDGDSGKESGDEALKDKPSAIVIQTAQEKVAVIRLQ